MRQLEPTKDQSFQHSVKILTEDKANVRQVTMVNAKFNILDVSSIVKQIAESQSVVLSTHKQCDGDGLGAMLGLHHALKKAGKQVRSITVDGVAGKYEFLEPDLHIENFEKLKTPFREYDLALIFDTNDRRLVSPLFEELEKHCKTVLFIDHHPVLNQGPVPTPGSFIDTSAASTGEISYFIIKNLGIDIDEKIARALYTSLAFDTQIFKYVKNSPNTHMICAELLAYEKQADKIHRALFSNYTRKKITYLGKVLSETEYLCDDRIAILNLSLKDLTDHELDMDDARDVIDMIMSVNTVQAAALVREDAKDNFKLSLRSKGRMEVLSIAESFGGGGHMFASGAQVNLPYGEIREKLVRHFLSRVDQK